MNRNESLRKWTKFDKNERWEAYKRIPAEYCTVLIVAHPERGIAWFSDILDGEEVFCRIRYRHGTNKIVDFFPCRLTRTKIFITQGIHPSECIII